MSLARSPKNVRRNAMIGPDRWQISYADLLTLLLGFFIVMYAVTSMEADKKHDIIEALRTEFGAQSNSSPTLPSDWALLQDFGFSVEQSGEWLYLEATSELLFDSGQATLKPKAEQALDSVGQWLASTYGPIEVEGHTDNLPINTTIFPSNWALSSARAVAIVDYLMQNAELDGARFSAVGMGEFSPIADNATVEGRRLNRRVIIKARANESLTPMMPPALFDALPAPNPTADKSQPLDADKVDSQVQDVAIDQLKAQLKAQGIEAMRTQSGGLKFSNGE